MRHIGVGIGEFERIDVILLAGQTIEEPRVYYLTWIPLRKSWSEMHSE